MEPGRVCECTTSGIKGHDMAQVVRHWPRRGGPVHGGGRQSDPGTGLRQLIQLSHQYCSINVQYAPFPTVRAVEILQI